MSAYHRLEWARRKGSAARARRETEAASSFANCVVGTVVSRKASGGHTDGSVPVVSTEQGSVPQDYPTVGHGW